MLTKILEVIPTLSNAALIWKEVLGKDYEIFESHWLVPTERPFTSYFCRACGGSHGVVYHSKTDIVSVPPSESHCERRPLGAEDVRILEFDLTAMGRALCQSLEIAEDQAVIGRGAVRRLGWIGQSQSQYPVYMLLKNPHQAATVAKNLLLEEEQPFVLFSGAGIPALLPQFKKKNCVLFALERILSLTPKGLTTSLAGTELFSDFVGSASTHLERGIEIRKLSTKLDAVLEKGFGLEKQVDRLQEMQAKGLFDFLQKCDAESLRYFLAILSAGDIAKASRVLGMADRTLRDRVSVWKGKEPHYQVMYDLVGWRKKVGGKVHVPFNDAISYESDPGASTTLLKEILEALRDQDVGNWSSVRDELVEILEEEVPQ